MSEPTTIKKGSGAVGFSGVALAGYLGVKAAFPEAEIGNLSMEDSATLRETIALLAGGALTFVAGAMRDVLKGILT